MQGVVRFLEEAQTAIEQVATTRGRVALSVLILLVGVTIALAIAPRGLRRLQRRFSAQYLDSALGEALGEATGYVPAGMTTLVLWLTQLLVLIVALFALLLVWGLFDIALIGAQLLVESIPYLGRLIVMVGILIGGIVVFHQLRAWIDQFSERTDQMTDHQKEIILRVGQLTVVVTVIASILAVWGINPSGLLVGAGFLGIIVGFAARQTLGSLIAGFVLMFSRPFTIGDWVEIGDHQGIVTDITIFNTRLENFDGEVIVLPNDRVADSAVRNRSTKGLLRIRTEVGIDYADDPAEAVSLAEEVMMDLDVVTDTPTPQAVPTSFGDSAILIDLRYWIDHPSPPRRWDAVSAVVTAVRDAYAEAGITIPFPQQELSSRAGFAIAEATPGTDRAAQRPERDPADEADGE
jgi:small-conductance mechanosensitive channel